MKSIVRRAAIGAGLVAAVLVATLQPAAAATSITPVPFGPNAVRFDYTLDTDARTSTVRPSLTSGAARCSGVTEPGHTLFFATINFTVSESGTYSIADARSDGAELPVEYQAAGRSDVGDARAAIYEGVEVTSPLDDSCLTSVDDFIRSPVLQAGQPYTLVLLNQDESLGDFSMFLSGPGRINVNDTGTPTLEQARAACLPGAPVPFGYTLREGTARNDTLVGTAGKDLVRGLGGQDTIRGLGGDDILCGGDGQDSVQGGDGADFVLGELGNDTLQGDAGDDVLDGAAGTDTLYGNAGDDQLSGGADLDVLDGGAGTDTGTDGKRDVFRSIETRVPTDAPEPVPTASR